MSVGLLLLPSSPSPPQPSTPNTTPNPNHARHPKLSTRRRTHAPPRSAPSAPSSTRPSRASRPSFPPCTPSFGAPPPPASLLINLWAQVCGWAVNRGDEAEPEMLRWDWAGTEPRLIDPCVLVPCGLLAANPARLPSLVSLPVGVHCLEAGRKERACAWCIFGSFLATFGFRVAVGTPAGTSAVTGSNAGTPTGTGS